MGNISFTNLRVYVDEKVHPIYRDLTSRAVKNAEDFPFTMMPDLFMTAACLGAKYEKYQPLGTKRKDIFVADAFDTKIHIPLLVTLAYKKLQNVDKLSNGREILSICENWANGGIHLLHDQLLSGTGLRPLYRLIDFINEEE